MTKLIKYRKFLIIKATARELDIAIGGEAICDHCGCHSDMVYYIAASNKWLCPECLEEWKETAHWYPEDADAERKNYEFYANRFWLKM